MIKGHKCTLWNIWTFICFCSNHQSYTFESFHVNSFNCFPFTDGLLAKLHTFKDARHYSKMKTPYLNFDRHSFDEHKYVLEAPIQMPKDYVPNISQWCKDLKIMSSFPYTNLLSWLLCLKSINHALIPPCTNIHTCTTLLSSNTHPCR